MSLQLHFKPLATQTCTPRAPLRTAWYQTNASIFDGIAIGKVYYTRPIHVGHADVDLKVQKCPCVKHGDVLGKYSHV